MSVPAGKGSHQGSLSFILKYKDVHPEVTAVPCPSGFDVTDTDTYLLYATDVPVTFHGLQLGVFNKSLIGSEHILLRGSASEHPKYGEVGPIDPKVAVLLVLPG